MQRGAANVVLPGAFDLKLHQPEEPFVPDAPLQVDGSILELPQFIVRQIDASVAGVLAEVAREYSSVERPSRSRWRD